jgi:hypothetical protein
MNPIITDILGNLVPAFKNGFIEVTKRGKPLTLRIICRDFLSVFLSVGFLIIPSFVVGLLLIVLPQGRDALLLVVEELAEKDPLPLIFFLGALFFWSVSAELSVRYAIYVSDNSGRNLSDERVVYRKTIQKLIAGFSLLWPYFVAFVTFIWDFFNTGYMDALPRYLSFSICFLLVYVLMAYVSNLYFQKSPGSKPGRPRKTRFGARSLPDIEYKWVGKLYGIYNDYVYTLPKKGNFKENTKLGENYIDFSDTLLNTPSLKETFLKDKAVMVELRVLPEEFELTDPSKIVPKGGENYKWTYCIPYTFYKILNHKVARLAWWSFGILLFISLIPVKADLFGFIGAPALICAAFACYSGIYCGLLFLDNARWRKGWISTRFVLVILFLLCSYFNNDHPIRMNKDLQNYKRPGLTKQFNQWFSNYKNKIDAENGGDTANRKYPVIFVCAEGGALRTGAFTSIFLTTLDSVLAKDHHIDFRSSIFAMSGVSGGSVGLGFYNALVYRTRSSIADSCRWKAQKFFLFDSLSPIAAKMFYGEFLNLFIPWNISLFNRADALEDSWEVAYQEVAEGKQQNEFAKDFIDTSGNANSPLLAINTEEVETGFQCWMATQSMDGLLFQQKRDLLRSKVHPLHYSTAINFSSRFPIFSPGAKIGGEDSLHPKFHYLDGGYVENTGSGTMLEILQQLKKDSPGNFEKVVPVVIYLLFSDNSAEPKMNVSLFNEISEIGIGIYDTRVGRSKSAELQLRNFAENNNHGPNIREPLSPKEKDVPMNWVLSGQSMDKILEDVDKKITDKSDTGVMKKMLGNGLIYPKSH